MLIREIIDTSRQAEPSQEDLENIEHDKATRRKPDIRDRRIVAMPGNTATYGAF